MTLTDTIPGGIAALKDTCWHLVYANGEPVDSGDGVPHFDTEDQAREEAARYTVARLGQPELRTLDAPCWIASAHCGYRLDENNTMLMHHESAGDALKAALDSEMFVGPCGRLHCSPDCDDCPDACPSAGQREPGLT